MGRPYEAGKKGGIDTSSEKFGDVGVVRRFLRLIRRALLVVILAANGRRADGLSWNVASAFGGGGDGVDSAMVLGRVVVPSSLRIDEVMGAH